VEQLSVTHSKGRLTDIRLGCKGLSGTNTLAYQSTAFMTKKGSFILLTPGSNVMKLFEVKLKYWYNKLACLSLPNIFTLVLSFRGRILA
jgi:hypothetical protein